MVAGACLTSYLPGAEVLYRGKFRFQNPILQNRRHVRAIQELLEFLPADVVRPVVVFTGDAEFKTTIPDGVFTLAGFLAYVEGRAEEVMSINRVQFSVGRLETARLSITKATDVSMFKDCDIGMVTMSRVGISERMWQW